jgi:O-antigen/teichoic acid export membrane protein
VDEPSSNLAVRMAANTIVQAVGSLLASLVGFVTFVAVTRYLGPGAFGDFTAATVFLFIPVVLADVGLSAAVLRDISADPTRTEPAMRSALPLRVIVSALAVLVAVGVGLALPFNDQTRSAILIASVGAFFQLMTLALLPVLQSQLKMHWAVGATLAGRLTTLGLTLGVLAAGLGFRSVVVAHVAGLAVTFLLHLVVVARMVPLRPVIDVRYWRRLVAGAVVLGLAIGVSQIYFRVDAVLLALLRSADEVGFYGAAYKFIELSGIIVSAVGVSIFPPLARFVATGDPRARRLVQRGFDILLAAAAPLAVLMLTFPEEIVVLAAGPEFREGGEALQLLAPYVLFSFANGVMWSVLISANRDRALLAMALGILVLNVGLNLLLIPEYGFKAAAAISVVSEAAIAIPIALVVRQEGLLPNLRFIPVLLLGVAAMIATLLVMPGPWELVAAVGAAVYAAVVLVLPGTARDVLLDDLVAGLRKS